MQFELAMVISCDPGGCRVMPVNGDTALDARYSAKVLNRVRILPGQLVAVDMEPAVPEVAWRWYRARIVEAGESQVTVQERERQRPVARVPGMETGASMGDEVWVTGMHGVWELHDRVVDGKPANPSRLQEKVIPRIAGILSGGEQA